MSNEPHTPTVTVTDESEDVTEKERSPVENAFYESFLIQSRSAIENLYASNIYHSQRHAKEVKDLEKQKQYSMSQMTNRQKEMVKKMAQLQKKQEQIMLEKRKQRLQLQVGSTKGDHRIRPHTTSSLNNRKTGKTLPKHRPRSGSLPHLEPLDLSRSLSKSSENLCSESSLLSASPPSNMLLSRSCEDLLTLGKRHGKVILPSLSTSPGSKSIKESRSDDSDSTFITRTKSSPPTKPKVNLNLAPSSFKPEHRRGSLDPSIIRELDRRRGVTTDSPPSSPKSTQTKWVPKSYGTPLGRGLPPV